ncbi:hypothetical protein I3843_04G175100 [Carya illinoinensis]|uniref:CDT1 Geminin-binding domain-containing protein n=1 Tax=Carya illinoinensis TaxID=32201 RepID=A0A922JSM4_CARIL|nr:hypothetical protein I3842_04G184700 [Carya illinoinensis]KAG7984716.1 hypothetical protein I3843_04G175100 [Carya illinoinensis]
MNPLDSMSSPFDSKKPRLQAKSPSPNQLSSKTPEKSTQLPHRSRNRGVTLSINEVRKVAVSLRDSDRPDQSMAPQKSARRQIKSWLAESPIRESEKSVGGPIKLPEKYEILAEFLDSLDGSIRLLRLKGSAPTFTNICPKIECLTDRRFSYGHLAQMKFILRNAIEIKRLLVIDERTSCMKPDLHVSINIDAIEDDGTLTSESRNIYLRKVFRERLADFSKSNPEVDEIPEETLPEPFNRTKPDIYSNMRKIRTSTFPVRISIAALTAQQSAVPETSIWDDENSEGTELDLNSNVTEVRNLALPVGTSIEALTKQQPVVASHLPQSFRKNFSQKVTCNETDTSSQNFLKTSLQPSADPVPESPPLNRSSSNEEAAAASAPTPQAKLSNEPASNGNNIAFCASPACLPPSCPPATPSKVSEAINNKNSCPTEIADVNVTPAKHTYTPDRLMNVTPTLHPPKRCHMSPEDDCNSTPHKLLRRPPRSRSLKFDTPEKNENVEVEIDDNGVVSTDTDISYVLPENLLQSIREKEMKAIEEQNPAISRAKRRQKIIASLPKVFNTIHFLFLSIKQSVITKQELIHKIIASHCNIVDRREVEELLSLLLELVPEWISEKLAYGDLLFCINKKSSPESVRVRLEEAKQEDTSV